MSIQKFNHRCDEVAGVPPKIISMRQRYAELDGVLRTLWNFGVDAGQINIVDNSPAYHKFYESLKLCCEEYGTTLVLQLRELERQLEDWKAQHDR